MVVFSLVGLMLVMMNFVLMLVEVFGDCLLVEEIGSCGVLWVVVVVLMFDVFVWVVFGAGAWCWWRWWWCYWPWFRSGAATMAILMNQMK